MVHMVQWTTLLSHIERFRGCVILSYTKLIFIVDHVDHVDQSNKINYLRDAS